MGIAQVELLSAVVFDEASWDRATGEIDPAVIVRGELPGGAAPFVVDRIYRGSQGYYDETFVLLDPQGEVVYEHPYARISLRGEMFEDRFRDTVHTGVTIADTGEHTLVLLTSEREIGRIPVFIDAPQSLGAAGALGDALGVTLKKSAIIWLTIPQAGGDEITKPAWFVYDGGKVFVLTGPDEQQLTNLGDAERVTLTARGKDVRARIAAVPADVERVPNDSDVFDRIAQLGLGTRLNLPDGEAAFERWRSTCAMYALTPHA